MPALSDRIGLPRCCMLAKACDIALSLTQHEGIITFGAVLTGAGALQVELDLEGAVALSVSDGALDSGVCGAAVFEGAADGILEDHAARHYVETGPQPDEQLLGQPPPRHQGDRKVPHVDRRQAGLVGPGRQLQEGLAVLAHVHAVGQRLDAFQ